MKTTKEQRAEIRSLTYSADVENVCDDADEAERLEAENAKLLIRIETLEAGIRRIYEEAVA